jgi:hypothetical protein
MEISDYCKKYFVGDPIAYEDMEGKISTCDKSEIIEVDIPCEKKRYCYKIKEV